MINAIPYGRRKPRALQNLLDEGLLHTPIQRRGSFKYVGGVDVIYVLNWGPSTWLSNEETLLLAIEQDAHRFERRYPPPPRIYFVAEVTVHFKRIGDRTYGTHVWADSDGLVWGLERETTVKSKCLNDIFERIKKDAQKYKKEGAYKVERIVLSIRERSVD